MLDTRSGPSASLPLHVIYPLARVSRDAPYCPLTMRKEEHLSNAALEQFEFRDLPLCLPLTPRQLEPRSHRSPILLQFGHERGEFWQARVRDLSDPVV